MSSLNLGVFLCKVLTTIPCHNWVWQMSFKTPLDKQQQASENCISRSTLHFNQSLENRAPEGMVVYECLSQTAKVSKLYTEKMKSLMEGCSETGWGDPPRSKAQKKTLNFPGFKNEIKKSATKFLINVSRIENVTEFYISCSAYLSGEQINIYLSHAKQKSFWYLSHLSDKLFRANLNSIVMINLYPNLHQKLAHTSLIVLGKIAAKVHFSLLGWTLGRLWLKVF